MLRWYSSQLPHIAAMVNQYQRMGPMDLPKLEEVIRDGQFVKSIFHEFYKVVIQFCIYVYVLVAVRDCMGKKELTPLPDTQP